MAKAGVTLEKLLVTHGHLDHCGQAGMLAKELGLPIEGPHEADRFWIAGSTTTARASAWTAEVFEPDRWLDDGDTVDRRRTDARGDPLPRPHAGPRGVLPPPDAASRSSATCCSRARSAAPTFPMGNHQDLIDSITQKLWPLGDDVTFIPGHGPTSTFGQRAQTNAVRQRSRRCARERG